MTQTLAVAAAAEAEVTSCLCHNSGRLHGLQIYNMSQRFSLACSCWIKTQTASEPGTCMNLHQCARTKCLQVSFLWTKVTAETTERWFGVSQTTKFSWHLKKSLLIYACQSTVYGIILSLFHNTGKQRWEKQNRKQQTGRSSAALISQFADVRWPEGCTFPKCSSRLLFSVTRVPGRVLPACDILHSWEDLTLLQVLSLRRARRPPQTQQWQLQEGDK